MQTLLHGVDGVPEVGTHAVELVDEGDAGDAEVAGLTPHGLGLRLHAGNGVEHGHSAVEHAEGALDLGREVHVARGVDDLDAVVVAVLLPEAGGGSGLNGHAALLLLHHEVHGGSALVHLADLVRLARVVQDALGRGGLAGIDVGHDADVAGMSQVVLALSHGVQFLPELPAVVREGTVGLGHLEDILALLHGSTHAVGGVEDLVGQALGHGLLLTGTAEGDDPADGQLRGATGVDLHRQLVGGATNTLGLDLEGRLDVVHSLLEGGQGVAALGLGGHDVEGAVDDALGGGLLTVQKDLVDELRHEAVVVDGIRLDLAAVRGCTTRHKISPLTILGEVLGRERYLGRLAP